MYKPTTNNAGRARFALVAALYKQQLGEVIKARREELGLTQKDLAERASIEEPQTVSRWERGLNAPTDLEAVARALETTATEMLTQLQPVTQKERRSIAPNGPSQLDRIEAKLDEVLSRLAEDRTVAALEAEVARLREQAQRAGAKSPRRTQSGKAA